jgi:2-methylisocitrate lyase-like PEP mutase family enzyme
MDAKTQQQYAETFHGLHKKGDPLVLFNAWDVATAKAIAKTPPAVATSSAAVASALGYADGEDVPLDMVTGLVSRMTAAVSVPISIDLEAGYGDTPDAAAKSVTKILKAGAIGIKYRRRALWRKAATRQSRTTCSEDQSSAGRCAKTRDSFVHQCEN